MITGRDRDTSCQIKWFSKPLSSGFPITNTVRLLTFKPVKKPQYFCRKKNKLLNNTRNSYLSPTLLLLQRCSLRVILPAMWQIFLFQAAKTEIEYLQKTFPFCRDLTLTAGLMLKKLQIYWNYASFTLSESYIGFQYFTAGNKNFLARLL